MNVFVVLDVDMKACESVPEVYADLETVKIALQRYIDYLTDPDEPKQELNHLEKLEVMGTEVCFPVFLEVDSGGVPLGLVNHDWLYVYQVPIRDTPQVREYDYGL